MNGLFSKKLIDEIDDTLKNNRQVILLEIEEGMLLYGCVRHVDIILIVIIVM